MKVPTRATGRGPTFNVTPLIDIVFLLVIFFLVASHFAQREQQLAVNLPRLDTTSDYADSPRRLVVTITPDRQLYVAEQQVDLSRISQILIQDAASDPGSYEVQIRGDAGTPYSVIEPIMLLCSQQGVTRVGFKVHQSE